MKKILEQFLQYFGDLVGQGLSPGEIESLLGVSISQYSPKLQSQLWQCLADTREVGATELLRSAVTRRRSMH